MLVYWYKCQNRANRERPPGDTLNAWAGKHKDQEWALCCSTFEGCDTAAKFHAACDAHTPTLTVGHNSRHFTFGGFVRTLSLVSDAAGVIPQAQQALFWLADKLPRGGRRRGVIPALSRRAAPRAPRSVDAETTC